RVWLDADGLRLQVIRRFEVHTGLDLLVGTELDDVDRVCAVQWQVVEIGVIDDDIFVLADLVATHRLVPPDLLVFEWAPAFVANRRVVVRAEQPEGDALRLSREVQADRDGHHAEADGPTPPRSRHGESW